MTTLMYVGLGILVGVILVPVLLWLIIKFLLPGLLNWYIKRLTKKLGDLGMLNSTVPPFRVNLEQQEDIEWTHEELTNKTSAELVSLGYEIVGDFTADEIYGMQMRAFVNEQLGAYAVVYDWQVESVGVVIDLVAQFTDETGITCSNAPTQGLDEPPWETKLLVDTKTESGAVAELSARLEQAIAGRQVKPADSGLFEKFFTDAYGRKMDWQVNRGGITPEEVRRNMVLVHGVAEDEIDEEDVESVLSQWRSAISGFVSEKTRERFLRHITKMSAGEWEDVRDRLFIVHEQSLSDELIEELKYRLMEDDIDDDEESEDDYERREEQAERMLKPHFAGHSPRDAFENVQQVLPGEQRYKRIARITGPWPADVYVEPAEE